MRLKFIFTFQEAHVSVFYYDVRKNNHIFEGLI